MIVRRGQRSRFLSLLTFSWHVTFSEAQTSATAITINPATVSPSTANSITLTGAANGDAYEWSAANAGNCAGVANPSNALTSSNQAVVANLATGTYQLCYRAAGQSDSVAQTNGVLTVTAGTSATKVTIGPSSISSSVASNGFYGTSVTFTGSASGDAYSWSSAGASDCSGVVPSVSLTSTNEVETVNLGVHNTYQLCLRASGETDSVKQTNGVLTVVAGTTVSAITISPSSITAGVATSITFTGSANGAKFSWSAANAANCGSTTPSTAFTSVNEVVSVTQGSAGSYKLCYRAVGGSDSVSQTNGVLTVVTATSATSVTSLTPSSITTGVATTITFAGSAAGDKFQWSAAGASDCNGVVPSIVITSTNEAVLVTLSGAGTYQLCYRASGGSDSVLQSAGALTVVAATSATKISGISPASILWGVATSVTFTGSANGDMFSWSAAGATNCNGITPSTALSATNQAVTVTLGAVGTYQLCYRVAGGSDAVAQSSATLTVTGTSLTAVTISPNSISNGVLTSVHFTGAAVGDKFTWSAVGAGNCNGVTPSTTITGVNQVVGVTLTGTGTRQLCYRQNGETDSRALTNGAMTVISGTSASSITISPSSISASAASNSYYSTDITFTGSAAGDKYSWSAANAADCSSTTPSTALVSSNEVLSTTLTVAGTYRLCYRASGGSDSVSQTNGVLTVVAGTSATAISGISPTSATLNSATTITLTGSANGDKYSWSPAGAADCAGTTPSTALTSTNEAVSATFTGAGIYRLCYRAASGSDSVTQTANIITVPGTPAYAITISPSTVIVGTSTSVTFTGSSNGDKYSLSSLNAADCTGVTPSETLTFTNEARTITLGTEGTYRLCYRRSGNSDSVMQTSGSITVAPIPTTPVAGDPITWFGHRRVEFELPLSKMTTLLRMPDLEISAAPFKGLKEEQWIGRVVVKSTATGDVLLQVDANRDMTQFDRSTLEHQGRFQLETMTPLFPHLSRMPIDNQFLLPGTWTWGTFGKIACPFKRFEPCREAITIVGKFAKFGIVSSSAKEYYGDVADAFRNVHLDFEMFDMTNETDVLDGALPQMWGLKPMSAETKKLVKEVSYPYLETTNTTELEDQSEVCSQCSQHALRSTALE